MPEVISSFTGRFNYLSNFYRHPFIYEEIRYPTSEHAYQAAKCTNVDDAYRIATAGNARIAKKLGRACELREDWEDIKIDVMRDILRVKFKKGSHLGRLLVGTGDIPLVEGNTWNDVFWGVCNGSGENWLGRLLMEIRSELQKLEDED